jgi:hypothetical protein
MLVAGEMALEIRENRAVAHHPQPRLQIKKNVDAFRIIRVDTN